MKLFDFVDQRLLDKPTPTVNALAKKYGVSVDEVNTQLQIGIKVEMEHTSDPNIAKEIALDHLGEQLDYYLKLAKVDEVTIDNVHGIGQVPDNENVDYKGLKVLMSPATFLKLAAKLERKHAKSVDYIKKEIRAGKGIGAPFLIIDTPEDWMNNDFTKPAKVVGHEGRNRMMAVAELEGGQTPIETHLFFRHDIRNRHIKKSWIKRLQQDLIPERQQTPISGPFFTETSVESITLDEVYPGQSSGKLKNYIRRKYGGDITCMKASQVINDPDSSDFYKGRARWYKNLHCKGIKQIREEDPTHDHSKDPGAALTIWDIDDTLFRTTAKIIVRHADGSQESLTSSEFNSYQKQPGDYLDFSQFEDAQLFYATSKPIVNIWNTAQNTLANIGKRPGSKMVVVTARSDFDDKDVFLDTFEKHGMDMSKVHVYRAGNLSYGSSAENKKVIIRNLLMNADYTEARLFDDHLDNLEAFLTLKKEFPDIVFKAFPVMHSGKIGEPIIV